jgi:HK97 family phage major capsid protein
MTEAEKKAADQINKSIADLNTKIENGATKEELQNELNTIKEAQKGLISKDDFNKLEDIVKNQAELITELKESKEVRNKDKETLLSQIKFKKEELKSLVKGTGKEVTLKAPTYRASITDSNSQYVLGGITQLGVKQRSLYDVFRKVSIPSGNHAGKITYTDWDEDTIVRAAAAVAEGAQFPESTAKFRSYSVELKKIGDTLPVSEEFGEDEVSAAAELESFLTVNMETKIDNDLVNADGTGNNIKGLINYVPEYTAVAAGIPSPNIYDLTKKVKTDITFNRGSKYSPNFVVMNDNTADLLHLEKDKNDNYIFPDKMNIGSIAIIIDNNILDDQMVVGDSRFATIYEKEGFTLEKVYVNAQAIEDMATLKARKRMLFLIKNGDTTGFRKVTSISAALTTLGTV